MATPDDSQNTEFDVIEEFPGLLAKLAGSDRETFLKRYRLGRINRQDVLDSVGNIAFGESTRVSTK